VGAISGHFFHRPAGRTTKLVKLPILPPKIVTLLALQSINPPVHGATPPPLAPSHLPIFLPCISHNCVPCSNGVLSDGLDAHQCPSPPKCVQSRHQENLRQLQSRNTNSSTLQSLRRPIHAWRLACITWTISVGSRRSRSCDKPTTNKHNPPSSKTILSWTSITPACQKDHTDPSNWSQT
jgi:hypothetical protein